MRNWFDDNFSKFKLPLPLYITSKYMLRLTINSIYLQWSAAASLASNQVFGKWSGVDLRSVLNRSK